MKLETERLYMRELTQSDYGSLCKILQDEKTMYAYNEPFSDSEVQSWLDNQLARYEKYGFGLWAVIHKETDELIGQCGLTVQQWKDREVLEIGYLFRREYWHMGYASEAATACREYAFNTLSADEVCPLSAIRISHQKRCSAKWNDSRRHRLCQALPRSRYAP